MAEWLVASILLLALAVLLARRGSAHLLAPRMPVAVAAAGALTGWMLATLPFTPFRGGLDAVALAGTFIGLLAGRLAARAMRGWATGHARDVAAGAAQTHARIVHPLIAAGLVVSGAALLYVLVALRHEALEVAATPRDPETGVMRGAEDVRLDGRPEAGHAALLVHGFLGSPADFGDLPERLRAAGLTVHALRLPAHGTVPGALDQVVAAEEYPAAVEEARAALAANHPRVSLVGFSFGGALAVRSAASTPPHRLVLVNPWLGRTHTPWWSPCATDTLLGVASKVTLRVIRPPGFVRVNDPAGLARVRSYATVRTRASAAARELACSAASAEVASHLRAPTLVLLSDADATAPAEAAVEWLATTPLADDAKRVVRFARSDHLLLLDHDREAAIAAVVEFLTR